MQTEVRRPEFFARSVIVTVLGLSNLRACYDAQRMRNGTT